MAFQPETVAAPPFAIVRDDTKPPFQALVETEQVRPPGFCVCDVEVAVVVARVVVTPLVCVVVVELGLDVVVVVLGAVVVTEH